MVVLTSKEIKTQERQSSKGNQLKWCKDGIWYKADYTGYEGFAEYVISNLLKKSNIPEDLLCIYDTETIQYGNVTYNGCKSEEFLKNGQQLITLERLYKNAYGQSLYTSVFHIDDYKERLEFLVKSASKLTGIEDFGKYISILFAIDALFLNEDRHTHNIAVISDNKTYSLCPIFDNGAGLLSDTTMDYPMGMDILEAIDSVESKTICDDFDEQLDIAEQLYGNNIKFSFDKKDVENIIDSDTVYDAEVKERVKKVLFDRMRKYSYLFTK